MYFVCGQKKGMKHDEDQLVYRVKIDKSLSNGLDKKVDLFLYAYTIPPHVNLLTFFILSTNSASFDWGPLSSTFELVKRAATLEGSLNRRIANLSSYAR